MTDIQLIDVTVHVDETLDADAHQQLEADLRDQPGVVSVRAPGNTPHLFIVTYNPDAIQPQAILRTVTHGHRHAELIGM
ncbi:MAG: ATP-binding protein [Gammaproteobacteria bacterium]